MAIKRYNATTSQWELVGNPGTVTPGSIGAASLSSANTFTGNQTINGSFTSNNYFTAGKNKIINGDFYWNQRAFTSTTTTIYHFDRWVTQVSGGTVTTTPQTFTLGAAPVSGYEGKNFVQIQTASQTGTGDYAILNQRIESVRTLAGSTATVSFWAKATTGTPSIVAEVVQAFGTGGSPSAQVNTGSTKQTISTSWARYSFTFNIPSISGKTLGTDSGDHLSIFIWLSAGSNFNARTDTLGLQNNTFQIWGVQVEAGSVATPFTTATGTIQGELAACQRYYWLQASGAGKALATSAYFTSTVAIGYVQFPVTMRVYPTLIVASGTNFYENICNGGSDFLNSFSRNNGSETGTSFFNDSEASGTAGQAGQFRAINASSSIAWSAEL